MFRSGAPTASPRHRRIEAMLRTSDCRQGLAALHRALAKSMAAVVDTWASRYDETFADEAYFDSASFRGWAREELEGLAAQLETPQPDRLIAWLSERGRILRDRAVPFEEVVLSIHLLESACVTAMRAEGIDWKTIPEARETLDIINHVRIALLAQAYYDDAQAECDEDRSQLLDRLARTHRDSVGRDRFCGMLGTSLAMQRVFELIGIAAQTRSSVLVVGESGTGKELAARAIHRMSSDDADGFVPVNCAALPHDLIESELFGHTSGAFSGATQEKQGLFHAAHGGTLFLDEITELPSMAQAKLLRPLQEGRVRRVGATREAPVEVRIVASTNIEFDALKTSGQLRRDLYFRLQGFVIGMPPLRERTEDIPLLADHFLRRSSRPKAGITRTALERLVTYRWPGNVRELCTAIERAAAVGRGTQIEVDHLPVELRAYEPKPIEAASTAPLSLEAVERDTIRRALEATGGNKSRAARVLGISRKQLYVKIARYGVDS